MGEIQKLRDAAKAASDPQRTSDVRDRLNDILLAIRALDVASIEHPYDNQ